MNKSGAKGAGSRGAAPGFVPSKWETIDPEDVQAQAVTSSKWDFDDKSAAAKVNKLGIRMDNDDDDTDGDDIDGNNKKQKQPDQKESFVPFWKSFYSSLLSLSLPRNAHDGQQQQVGPEAV